MTLQELFADPKRWTQGTMARSITGTPVETASLRAVSFCILGGIKKCYDVEDSYTAADKVLARVGNQTITAWNDQPERTIEHVQRLVKELNI